MKRLCALSILFAMVLLIAAGCAPAPEPNPEAADTPLEDGAWAWTPRDAADWDGELSWDQMELVEELAEQYLRYGALSLHEFYSNDPETAEEDANRERYHASRLHTLMEEFYFHQDAGQMLSYFYFLLEEEDIPHQILWEKRSNMAIVNSTEDNSLYVYTPSRSMVSSGSYSRPVYVQVWHYSLTERPQGGYERLRSIDSILLDSDRYVIALVSDCTLSFYYYNASNGDFTMFTREDYDVYPREFEMVSSGGSSVQLIYPPEAGTLDFRPGDGGSVSMTSSGEPYAVISCEPDGLRVAALHSPE